MGKWVTLHPHGRYRVGPVKDIKRGAAPWEEREWKLSEHTLGPGVKDKKAGSWKETESITAERKIDHKKWGSREIKTIEVRIRTSFSEPSASTEHAPTKKKRDGREK